MGDDVMDLGEVEGITDLEFFRQAVPCIKSEDDLLRYQQIEYMVRTLGSHAKAQYKRIKSKLKAFGQHKASLIPELHRFIENAGEEKTQPAGHKTHKVTTLVGTTSTRKDTDWKLNISDEEDALFWAGLNGILEEGDTEVVVSLTAAGRARIKEYAVDIIEDGGDPELPDGITITPPGPSVATRLRGAPRLTELREVEEEIYRRQAAIGDPIHHLEHKEE